MYIHKQRAPGERVTGKGSHRDREWMGTGGEREREREREREKKDKADLTRKL